MPRTHITKLLTFLRKQKHLKFLPSDFRSLLKTMRNVETRKVPPGEYHHIGIKTGIVRSLIGLAPNSFPAELKVQINIDRLPLSKSSKSQFWIILGLVKGIKGAKPFVIGVYEGDKKPNDVNIYLEDFLRDAMELENVGLHFRDKHIQVTFSGFICDAPAKAFFKRVKAHTGFYGCSKCSTKCVYYRVNRRRKGRVTFPELSATLRTNLTFRQQNQKQHHKGKTGLLHLAIDMVKAFPLDPMHLLDLGIMRKLLVGWVRSNHPGVKISSYKLIELNEILVSLVPYIPNDFSRVTRSLEDLPRWKATEHRLFRMYVGPVVLKNILSE